MSDIIQLLPDAIANQIAAGEVVQRPASVVKELVENAIDASSTRISIVIKEAGKSLIQVIDNGKGMSATDARMSFERHATSKIRSAEDIYAIRTLGFRGEALASIAAVAQVTMITRQADSELAHRITIEGSALKEIEPVSAAPGTNISIKNLFYNIPARRNFLKSNSVELRHIVDEFFRIALAYPEIDFEFFQHDTEIYHLTAGDLHHRVLTLFGDAYAGNVLPCQEETPHVRITGYVGKPGAAKRTRGEQFFFVNQRFIKSSYLNHAVMSAYEALLPDATFPFYTLFLDIDPQHIDVNVHPTKTEIKFSDERTVYAIVRAAVKRSLGTNLVTPSLGEDDYFPMLKTSGEPSSTSEKSDYQTFRSANPWQETNLKQWENAYETPTTAQRLPKELALLSTEEDEEVTFQSAANRKPTDGPVFLDSVRNTSELPFQIHQSYIAIQVKSGLMLIDQQAAHERILYEQYALALEKKSTVSQQTLFPQTITLHPADVALVQELQDEIMALGFDLTIFGKDQVVVNGIPVDIKGGTEASVLEDLIEQFKNNQARLSIDKRDNVVRSLAKRTAVRAGQTLSPTEMSKLIDRLFACINANYAPDGRRTFYILALDKIAALFN